MELFKSTTHLLTGRAEKVLQIFYLSRPDAPPTLLESFPGTPIRAAVWHHGDQTILSSSNDVGGVSLWCGLCIESAPAPAWRLAETVSTEVLGCCESLESLAAPPSHLTQANYIRVAGTLKCHDWTPG